MGGRWQRGRFDRDSVYTKAHAFSAEEQELAQVLANQAMLAIQMARLSVRSHHTAMVEERNRVARDIHDTLAQGFTGVIAHLEAARGAVAQKKSAKVSNHLERAGELAREGLREARRSVQALRPLALEEKVLTMALRDLFERMTTGMSMKAKLTAKGEPAGLSQDLETNLLRIGQEVLTNAIRHSRARKFNAMLVFGISEIRLTVRDDGCGFEPAKTQGGIWHQRNPGKGQGNERKIHTSKCGRQGHGHFHCGPLKNRPGVRRHMSGTPNSRNLSAARPAAAANRKKNAHARKIKVLIADDHSTFLTGLASIIDMEDDMMVIAQATDGRQAVDLWRKFRPSVTLLDLRMPILDGVGAIDEIRREDNSAKIIMLTTYDKDNDIYRAIKAGTNGYLLKDARREELLDCIRKVDAGETCVPQGLMDKLVSGIRSEPLTDREAEVLKLLANGKSNKDIGGKLSISEFTVKGHLRNIFNKLGVLSRTEAISVATRRGLVKV